MSRRAADPENEARLQAALAAALEREAALARIAQRINEHPLDVDGTLLEISEAARKLTDGDGARVWLFDGEKFTPTQGAMHDGPAEFVHLRSVVEASSDTPVARCVRERRTVAVADFTELALSSSQRESILAAGTRSTMAAPLGRGDAIAGSLAVVRSEVRPFSGTEMTTLEAFAAQAAIAIETARAQQALAEGLARETATAEILSVISRSPSDLQAALDAVVLKAGQLLDSHFAAAVRFEPGGSARMVVISNYGEVSPAVRLDSSTPYPIDERSEALDAVTAGRTHMGHGGVERIREHAPALALAWERNGMNSAIATPLTTSAGRFGILIVGRASPEPYSEPQIRLLETFAAQAVIAIGNARLFDDLEQSNAELAASVEREAALARISQRINEQPLDVDGTLLAIAESARTLTGGNGARVFLLEGDRLTPGPGAVGDTATDYAAPQTSVELSSEIPIARAVRECRTIAVDDFLDLVVDQARRDLVLARGIRSNMVAPLGRADSVLGSLSVVRAEVRPFNATEMATLEAFAAQAATAIETARAQRALAEALEQQTATADVLDVISRAPANLQAALDAVVAKACRLLESFAAVVIRHMPDGSRVRVAVAVDGEIAMHSRLAAPTRAPEQDTADAPGIPVGASTRMLHGGPDAIRGEHPELAGLWEAAGVNSSMAAPLTTAAERFGQLVVSRRSAAPYTASQVRLFETFASQAVIAIENTRLFDEVQQSNADLAASVEREAALARVSQRINEQPLDVDGTLLAIAEAARTLTASDGARVWLIEGEDVVGAQMSTRVEGVGDVYRSRPARESLNDGLIVSQATRTGRTVVLNDAWAAVEKLGVRDSPAHRGNLRAMMAAPILREGVVLGSLFTVRTDLRGYSASETASLEAFAA